MKTRGCLVALSVLVLVFSAPGAWAWGHRHAFAGGSFGLQSHPFSVRHPRPFVVMRRPFVAHSFFFRRPFFVERRFFVPHPFIVARPTFVAPPFIVAPPVVVGPLFP